MTQMVSKPVSPVRPSVLTPRTRWQKWRRRLVGLAVFLLIAIQALNYSINHTAPATVHVVGQTLEFRVAHLDFSLSGPGYFEYRNLVSIPTTGLTFYGPIRPELSLPVLDQNPANAQAFTDLVRGKVPPGYSAADVRNGFIHGSWSYFAVLSARAIGFLAVEVILLYLIAFGLIGVARRANGRWEWLNGWWPWWRLRQWRFMKWLRWTLPKSAATFVGVVSLSVMLSFALALGSVNSVAGVVGIATPVVPPAAQVKDTVTQGVILGDSVPAGNGLPELAGIDPVSQACGRSNDAFASALATQLNMAVANLGCGTATIPTALYGSQANRAVPVPPQLSELEAMKSLKFIDINIGADDVDWSHLFALCYTQPECDNNLVNAYFETNLADFRTNFFGLLTDINTITNGYDHQVAKVVNLYYNPLTLDEATNYNCPLLHNPTVKGTITYDKAVQITSYLTRLNNVLRDGALAFGYQVATPNFAGHGLCEGATTGPNWDANLVTPYVQPLNQVGGSPLHPTAAGQLMIGLAVAAALPSNWSEIAGGLPRQSTDAAAGALPSVAKAPSSSVPSTTSGR